MSGTDNFTLELPSSTFVFNGEEIEAFPLIEVKWFERGQEIRIDLPRPLLHM